MASERVVYGTGPVGELLQKRARAVDVLYVQREDDKLAAVARQRGVDVEVRGRAELDALAGEGARHQGVVAITGAFEYADLDDVLDDVAARGATPLIVALDGVQDPHNLGAIVRSAYLLGAHAVVIPKDRAAGVTAVTTKSSAGATEHLPIAHVTNLVRALETMKQRDLWIAGVASHPDAKPIDQLDPTTPLCLVLGSEGKGIRRLVQKSCDFHVEIPMARTAVGSLNVSVAAAIALYELSRGRS
jgi:23S rRNA (guanosine2251-2'-O)-methyltransferase